MLLEYFCSCYHIIEYIEYILSFIENHSVLVGIITAVITGSLWFRKFLKQKRAEAFFGFYNRLSLRLKTLYSLLNDKDQLNIVNDQKGNIFSLLYTESFISKACPAYNMPDDEELSVYRAAAKELKKILLETNHNVFPKGACQEKWYDCQYTIFSFCEFLEHEKFRHNTNNSGRSNTGEPKHIVKCRELVEAINYIQKAIEQVDY